MNTDVAKRLVWTDVANNHVQGSQPIDECNRGVSASLPTGAHVTLGLNLPLLNLENGGLRRNESYDLRGRGAPCAELPIPVGAVARAR